MSKIRVGDVFMKMENERRVEVKVEALDRGQEKAWIVPQEGHGEWVFLETLREDWMVVPHG